MAEFLFIILVGFAAGFFSGAFGIVGAVITTPAIRVILGESSNIALGTPLPIVFPSAVVGGFNYWRAGKIVKRAFFYCSLFGLAGTVVGSLITGLIDTRYIMIITALLIIYLAYRTFATAIGKDPYGLLDETDSAPPAPVWKLALIGITAGFFSGFLGLGGGVILVPGHSAYLSLDAGKTWTGLDGKGKSTRLARDFRGHHRACASVSPNEATCGWQYVARGIIS